MADKHPSGNPDLIRQHKKIQREGDQEIAGTNDQAPAHQREERSDRRKPQRDTDNSGSSGGSFVGP